MAFLSCSKEDSSSDQHTIFTRLTANQTGIDFSNQLEESADVDVFRYRNYYNGAGVSIGDINNDGLADVYLTANSQKNRLFLNLGNFKFKDITASAGVGGTRAWSTGVSMVDVNADGYLDIYVCNSGDINGANRENELFINNGDLTFTERAKELGLDDKGFSTHAVFFDYDKDGDLDCYLLNNSFRPTSTLGYKNVRSERDALGGDKLLQNDNGLFKDVSGKAHIYGSVIGFGLGVTVGDVNNDNWPDIYVANDFFERDYLYINNHDGTFSESLEKSMGHISMFSMGADLADLNNDGYLDVLSTDMLPEDDYRLKTVASFDSYDLYQTKLNNGYYHQYMRNMLQLNNKDGTFSEIGQYAGVSATDWSWGALIADFDNNGNKEIFISNGIYRDVTDHDFLEFMANEENIRAALEGRKIDYKKIITELPSNKLSNYLYVHNGDLKFTNVSKSWGLDEPSFSNGSAYGDLDNDGDLDLIVNNVNQELFVYRNDVKNNGKNSHLAITFRGLSKNVFGVGAKVYVFNKGDIISNEHMPIRGYQSSMDYKMIIGLGELSVVDSMVVLWPDERIQTFKNVKTNQSLEVLQRNASVKKRTMANLQKSLFTESKTHVNYVHRENDYNEFNSQRSLLQMLSTEGPAMCIGDLNSDGRDDFYIGGGAGQAGAIFIQKEDGAFKNLQTTTFDADAPSEDIDAVFFDVDRDNDLDLYVVSGSSEFDVASTALQDRLYINTGIKNGEPSFEKAENVLPSLRQNGSCVKPCDYDNDGDIDLFVGTRTQLMKYGIGCDQYILENKGTHYENESYKSPDLKSLGMVTDAQWFDYDNDGLKDLIIVGEWMPVTVFKNLGKAFKKIEIPSLQNTNGWWNVIESADIDRDGDLDFVLGNLGTNTKLKASIENPVSLYVGDFDQNNSIDHIYTYQRDGKDYPVSLKQDLAKQMNFINKKFVYYKDFAGKSVDQILDGSMVERASILRAYENHTCILRNDGGEGFSIEPLPSAAQLSPVYSIKAFDVNGDGALDLIMGGNLFSVKTEIGRYDASYGLVCLGNGSGNFKVLTATESGIKLRGEIRNVNIVKGRGRVFTVIARNNDSLKVFEIKRPKHND